MKNKIFKALYRAANANNGGCLNGEAIGLLAQQAEVLAETVTASQLRRVEELANQSRNWRIKRSKRT